MKNRTLLGQILTVIIYLYNIAAVGLFVFLITLRIANNYVADKTGIEVPALNELNVMALILSFLFVGVVWFVFYFILKKVRDASRTNI